MSLKVDRRAAVAAGAIGLPAAANAALPGKMMGGKPVSTTTLSGGVSGDIYAPIVELFDSRGCEVTSHKEYKGQRAGSMEDEQCVKVSFAPVKVSQITAAKLKQQFVSGKQSSINVAQ